MGGLAPIEKFSKNEEPIKQYVNRKLVAGIQRPWDLFRMSVACHRPR